MLHKCFIMEKNVIMKINLLILLAFIPVLCPAQSNCSKPLALSVNHSVTGGQKEVNLVPQKDFCVSEKIAVKLLCQKNKKDNEKGFIAKSIEPSVFWGAFSALCTAFGIILALFLPVIKKTSRTKYLSKIIIEEVSDNLKIAKAAQTPLLLPGTTQASYMSREEFIRHLKFDAWDEYKFRLADYDINAYTRYKDAYKSLYAIVGLEQVDKRLIEQMYKDEVESFIEKCENLKLN